MQSVEAHKQSLHRSHKMAKLKIRGKELLKIGYPEGPAIGMAINMVLKHHKRLSKSAALELLQDVLENQEKYKGDAALSRIVDALNYEKENPIIPLQETGISYPSYGENQIEQGAKDQMNIAARLPVTVQAALMPDAHQGYGLPIGGVLATNNAIIPYGVGVDIGCRMCLTVYDLSPKVLDTEREKFSDLLKMNTRFGFTAFENPMDDALFERKEFKEIPKVKSLFGKARAQIGSSGGGNHFVEFGIAKITDENNEFKVPVGEYVAVLSHSGSRGMGAQIANHYTKLAMEKTPLPKEAKHLAWLDLDSAEGMEYWLAMNLAGDYASACHEHIHCRMAQSLGLKPIARVENHHNFAWKEQMEDGQEVIVHRKGATPAGKGVLGIIPGSMTAPGYIVRGKGEPLSINSASHGAGRQMSRTKAKNSITQRVMKNTLAEQGVHLIGGGLDEAPQAYKPIKKVMAAQTDLVDIVGEFLPKVVRMAE